MSFGIISQEQKPSPHPSWKSIIFWNSSCCKLLEPSNRNTKSTLPFSMRYPSTLIPYNQLDLPKQINSASGLLYQSLHPHYQCYTPMDARCLGWNLNSLVWHSYYCLRPRHCLIRPICFYSNDIREMTILESSMLTSPFWWLSFCQTNNLKVWILVISTLQHHSPFPHQNPIAIYLVCNHS